MIGATPGAIYDAYMEPAALVQWLPPADMRGEIETFEAREGGHYRVRLIYKGEHARPGKADADADIVEGRFVQLRQGKRIVQSVVFESDDARFAGEMTMAWDLRPVEGGNEVTITAENVPEGISAEDHATGMGSTLANLAAFVE